MYVKKMLSLKPLKPSAKEKKRYIVYGLEIKGNFDKKKMQQQFINKLKENLGIISSAKAGIIPILIDFEIMKGILRVNHKMVDEIKANFLLISKIGTNEVRISSLGVSGILKKAKENYMYKNKEEK